MALTDKNPIAQQDTEVWKAFVAEDAEPRQVIRVFAAMHGCEEITLSLQP